jgi:hypothetical protein
MKTSAPLQRAASPAPARATLVPARGWEVASEPAAAASEGHELAAVAVRAPAADAPIQRTNGDGGNKKDRKQEKHVKLDRNTKRRRDKLPKDVQKGAHPFKAATRMGADESLDEDDFEEIRQGNRAEEKHRQVARAQGEYGKQLRRQAREKEKGGKTELPRDPDALQAIIDGGVGDVAGARKLLKALKKRAQVEEPEEEEDTGPPDLEEDEPQHELPRREDDEDPGPGSFGGGLGGAIEVG